MVSRPWAVDGRLQLAESSDGLVESAVATLRIRIKQYRHFLLEEEVIHLVFVKSTF